MAHSKLGMALHFFPMNPSGGQTAEGPQNVLAAELPDSFAKRAWAPCLGNLGSLSLSVFKFPPSPTAPHGPQH